MTKETFSTNTEWEKTIGYSRAIKIGNIIEVAGTTAVDNEGNLIGLDDAYKQTCFIIKKIENALQQLGSKLEDIVRTRIYLTNIQDWKAVGKAHGEFFAHIKPVSTMVEVSALINSALLVEIEVTAVVQNTE
ncbi:MAG: RidA family protein [Cytophagales bacterium]|nr:MAG: RidA family protein [Cytophagales bacterium]